MSGTIQGLDKFKLGGTVSTSDTVTGTVKSAANTMYFVNANGASGALDYVAIPITKSPRFIFVTDPNWSETTAVYSYIPFSKGTLTYAYISIQGLYYQSSMSATIANIPVNTANKTYNYTIIY